MIQLVTIPKIEFSPYLQSLTKRLTKQYESAFKIDYESAQTKVEKLLSKLLFQNPDIFADQFFYYLESANTKVGSIWIAKKEIPETKEIETYLWDLEIYPEHQKKGLGELAIKKVESLSKEWGSKKIHLNVFGFNEAATRLYEKMGFIPLSTQMIKSITLS